MISYQQMFVEDEQLNIWESIGTIQYMGSKTRILSSICPELISISGVDTFVDLFSGTAAVSYALKDRLKVYSNDLQRYAYVINEAILNGASFNIEEEILFFESAQRIYNKITNVICDAVILEQDFFISRDLNYLDYQFFCDETPSVFKANTNKSEYSTLSELCKNVLVGKLQNKQKTDLPVLFLTYYANTYFGIQQSCEIDAIRAAIDKVNNKKLQNILLAALMSAMSTAVSATTHFAQFLKIRDKNTASNLIEKRKLSIFTLMKEKLIEFREKGLLSRQTSIAVCGNMDYLEFLNSVPLGENTLVYADPPYFKEHYSRYYHILETLCLYDYPEITFNHRLNDFTAGRYRDDRAVSPFGKKSHALNAFKALVDTCGNSSAPLAISYADNSIVDFNDIKKLFDENYDVTTKLIPLKHSNQGRSNSNNQVNEVLIIGKPKIKYHSVGQLQINNVLKKLEETDPLYDTPASAIHNYMARKPYNVLSEIINGLLTEKGIVLDPFCGSGTTLIESRKQGHSAIGVDLNQQAVLISMVSLGNWDLDKVEKDINSFVNEIARKINSIYEVHHNDSIRIIERCHFDLIEGELVPTSYKYKEFLANNKLGPRRQDQIDDVFLEQYLRVKDASENMFSDKFLLPNSRIAVAQGATVSDYLCPRNKLALKEILSVLASWKKNSTHQILEVLVSSALNLIRLSDKKASSQMPYWRPSKDITSRNALFIIQNKAKSMIEGLKFLKTQFQGRVVNTFEELSEEAGSLLIKSAIQKVPVKVLPDESIDLVITDPPYTDQVPYLEYSQLWALLLGWDNLSSKVLDSEIVVSNSSLRKDKTFDNYYKLMSEMFIRVAKAMKPYSHMAMFFHDFSLNAWSCIIRSAEQAGLAYQGQVKIGRQRRSFKTVMSPNRTLDGNYLIIFRKRAAHPPIFDGNIETAIQRCEVLASEIIRENGGKATSQDLYDKGLLRDSIESGTIHILASRYNTFIDVIKQKYKYNEGYWSEL
ncbi:DNA adenine methylase [Paenibacillus humicus]|uniref:DNA adenine methylase n=1 Tax=Paenibacillus humicus TaxID=412861 RepID=UPI003D26C3E4